MASAGRLRFGRPTPVGPVLANVAYPRGGFTPAARGTARMNSSTAGLVVSGTPSTYTVTQTGGTSGHFQDSSASAYTTGVAKVISEGSGAIFPVNSSAGYTAKLNGGPYTFTIKATDSLGNDSNTITLTITGDPNSVTLGDDFGTQTASAGNLLGVTIASYAAASSAPRYMYLAQGIARGAIGFNNFDFTAAPVIMKDANASFPSSMDRIECLTTNSVTFRGFIYTGSWLSTMRIRLGGNAGTQTDIIVEDCQIGVTLSDLIAGKNGIVFTNGVVNNVTIRNNVFHYTSLCIGPPVTNSTNITVTGNKFRWFHEGVMSCQNIDGLVFSDNVAMSPLMITGSGLHPDFFQKGDGNTLKNATFERNLFFSADATLGLQGIYFGPTTTNPTENLIIRGWAFIGWSITGIRIFTNSGTSEISSVTQVKANTGDDTDAPVGAKFEVTGPSISYSSESAGWSAALTQSGVFTGDDIVDLGYSPAPTLTTSNTTAANLNATTIADAFTTGNPNTVLSATSLSAWAAMTDDQVIAAAKAAIIPKAGGVLDLGGGLWAGALLPNGSWNV